MSRELIEGLLEINCKYLHRVRFDGKCYSSECMLNQNPGVKLDIEKKGCRFYLKNPEIKIVVTESKFVSMRNFIIECRERFIYYFGKTEQEASR